MSRLNDASTTVVRLQQVVASELSLVWTTGARLPNTCACKTAEILNAKKIPDEDHEAILEEIGMREGIADHDEEGLLGDASRNGLSSEEENGSHSSNQE
jgi:hypothetical protein